MLVELQPEHTSDGDSIHRVNIFRDFLFLVILAILLPHLVEQLRRLQELLELSPD